MIAAIQIGIANSQFARDISAGLGKSGQKEIPSSYLYDDLGSALFEAITLLPEYGLTRADARLLRQYALQIVEPFTKNLSIVELGSGTGTKTRWILEAATARGRVSYFPIDISPAALEKCRFVLEPISGLRIHPLSASYLDGLREAVTRRSPGENLLVLFLGSTIGNFYPSAAEEFLEDIRRALLPGDALLLGTDLVKPVEEILVAYDDPLGVTAAFNLNILSRINRELDADFVIGNFRHEARFNQRHSRIEMHLRSTVEQTIHVHSCDLRIQIGEGETIWTEASQKFRAEEVCAMARRAGFTYRAQWIDSEWPFAETLLIASA